MLSVPGKMNVDRQKKEKVYTQIMKFGEGNEKRK